MQSLKTSVLDQPVSLTVPWTPGVAPSIRLGSIRFPGNTKYGGICWPSALMQPMRVTILLFPAVTVCVLFSLLMTI